MLLIKAASCWTGAGPLLQRALIVIDKGRIVSVEPEAVSEGFDCPFVMPAFFDAHCHLSWMIQKRISLDLSAAGSKEELLQIVSEASASYPEGILRGHSFDESTWEVPVLPSLEELDRAGSGRAVFLGRICGHAALANSSMLDMLDCDPVWVDRSTGRVAEEPVMNFTRRFPPPDSLMDSTMDLVFDHILSTGVTGVCSIEDSDGIRRLQRSRCPIETSFSLRDPIPSDPLIEHSEVSMVKYFLDGSIGAGTAAMETRSAERLLYTDEALLEELIFCGRKGLTPMLHAIGGSALSQIDRVSRRAFSELNGGFTIRIEHAEDLHAAWPGSWDPRYHLFSMQPNFVHRWQRRGGLYEKKLGRSRSVSMNPFRTVRDAGFSLGFGSDSMPFDPLYGLRGAIEHPLPEQRLSTEESLFAYTLGSAAISGKEFLSLPLQPGRRADLVVLSSDPFLGLDGVSVVRTLSKGETVFEL